MPPEPKKPIEELLKASAEARRAEFGSEPKMPNPMRARLQDEIASLARSSGPEPRVGWFGIRWPQVIMGLAFASLVIGAFGLWRQTQHAPTASPRLAMDSSAAPREMDRLATTSAPVARSEKFADSLAGGTKDAAAESAAAAPFDGKSLSLAKAVPMTEPALPESRQSISQAAPASAGAVMGKKDEFAATLTQRFSQSAVNQRVESSAKLKQPQRILDNFRVEQNEREIRVVDSDGSTYSGQIERLTAADTRNVLKGQGSAVAARGASADKGKEQEEQPNYEFRFRALGVNNRLQKSVVFEGNYIVTALPPRRRDLEGAVSTRDSQSARILGTAKVSGEPAVTVDAVTVPSR